MFEIEFCSFYMGYYFNTKEALPTNADKDLSFGGSIWFKKTLRK